MYCYYLLISSSPKKHVILFGYDLVSMGKYRNFGRDPYFHLQGASSRRVLMPLRLRAEIFSEGSGSFFFPIPSPDGRIISQNSWMFASLTSHILCLVLYVYEIPIPEAVRFKAPVCGHSLAGISDSNPGGGMDVYFFGLIARPEESYRSWCV